MLLSVSEAIGRFHPLLVHLPIGVLMMAVLLQWLAANPKYAISKQVVRLVFLVGIAGALLSTITGFLLSNSGDYEGSTVAWHMWLGIATTACALLAFARMVQGSSDAKWLSLVLMLFVALTGHFGGSLTHGEDYLTAAWQGSEEKATGVKPIADVQAAQVYADVVAPLLESRCYSCHGTAKQKGKLRMDSPERLLQGGKNGSIITPGKADESELVKRLLLPREHEEHMPPKEKPQLTESQVALLHWWIEQGAPFDKKIADLQQPEQLKPVLAALQQGEAQSAPRTIIPEDLDVPEADAAAIAALRQKGVVLLPVAQGGHWLAANFVTARFTDADAALLLPLKQQLLMVKMNDLPVGDATLNVLAQCANIAILHLNNTRISDGGLVKLKTLTNLRSLSLAGTSVSVTGLAGLRGLPKLENIYLFGNEQVKRDWSRLRTLFPKVNLDSGGYRLPLLATDTALVAPPKR